MIIQLGNYINPSQGIGSVVNTEEDKVSQSAKKQNTLVKAKHFFFLPQLSLGLPRGSIGLCVFNHKVQGLGNKTVEVCLI